MGIKKSIFLLFFSLPAIGKQDSIKYSISLAAQFSDGNIKSNSLNGNGSLSGKINRIDWSLEPTYRYLYAYPYPITPISVPVKQDEFYMPSHISYRFKNDWKLIGFSEYEHSQLRKIQHRINLGIGVGKKIISSKKIIYELSGVVLPGFYQSMAIKNALPQRNNFSIRISIRSKFIFKADNFLVTSIFIFQPAVYSVYYDNNGPVPGWKDNINIRNTNSIEFPLFKNLFFGVEADWIYQSYLEFISDNLTKKDFYISPRDLYFSFYIKYKNR